MIYDQMVLGEGVVFGTDCNITQVNNNVLVCGSSGCGKTMSILEPKLLCTNHSSLIIALSKRRLVSMYTELFKDRGYQVLDLNFVAPEETETAYDPLQYLKSWTDVTFLAKSIVMADARKETSVADPYWDESAVSLLSSLICYVLMTKRHGNMADVIELFHELSIKKSDDLIRTTLDSDFEVIRKADPHCLAISCWDTFHQAPMKTAGCILSSLGTMLDTVFTPDLCKMMRNSEKIDFKRLSEEKTVLFITTSAVNTSLNTFVNIFYSQIFKELFEIGEKRHDGKLARPVQVLCDDFACGARILNFAEYISIFREKGISVTMLLQSESQLRAIYGEYDAKTIINNSDTYIYLGGLDLDTAVSVSRRLNAPLEDILYMPVGQEIIFRRGQKPIITKRYNILENQEYKKMLSGSSYCKDSSR